MEVSENTKVGRRTIYMSQEENPVQHDLVVLYGSNSESDPMKLILGTFQCRIILGKKSDITQSHVKNKAYLH